MRARVTLVNAAAAVACWLLDRADRRVCAWVNATDDECGAADIEGIVFLLCATAIVIVLILTGRWS